MPLPAPSIKTENGIRYIQCPVRKKWVVLTPEEKVRQFTIHQLCGAYAYPLKYISVEKTLKVNSDLIINQGVTKILMREAMLGYLPEKIRLRMDKVGYVTPDVEWLNGSKFRTLFNDIADYGLIKDLGIFDMATIKKMLSKQRFKSNEARELWKMLSLEHFFKQWYK